MSSKVGMEDFTATRPSAVIVLDLESEADVLARVGGRRVDMATGKVFCIFRIFPLRFASCLPLVSSSSSLLVLVLVVVVAVEMPALISQSLRPRPLSLFGKTQFSVSR